MVSWTHYPRWWSGLTTTCTPKVWQNLSVMYIYIHWHMYVHIRMNNDKVGWTYLYHITLDFVTCQKLRGCSFVQNTGIQQAFLFEISNVKNCSRGKRKIFECLSYYCVLQHFPTFKIFNVFLNAFVILISFFWLYFLCFVSLLALLVLTMYLFLSFFCCQFELQALTEICNCKTLFASHCEVFYTIYIKEQYQVIVLLLSNTYKWSDIKNFVSMRRIVYYKMTTGFYKYYTINWWYDIK